MTISDSTLDTDVWNTMRTILVAAAPLTTNSSTASTTAASILGAYNDKKVGKPQVIIHPIEMSEDTYKFGGKYGTRDINMTVDCVASKTEYTDQLTQQVTEAVRDAFDDMTIIGMDLVGLSTDQAFIDPNESKFQIKGITFVFRRE